jgi:hypothetical protein
MALPKLLQAVLILSLIPATAYAVATVGRPDHPSPASVGLATLSITADGNAAAIGDMDHTADAGIPKSAPPSLPITLPISDDIEMMPPAGDNSAAIVSITATVLQKNSSAVIAFNITGTSLTIGGTPYQIVNGTGIFNQRSRVVVLHATVTTGDWMGILILYGHADQDLSVTFDSPQSKLASKFFLELKGTLTLA